MVGADGNVSGSDDRVESEGREIVEEDKAERWNNGKLLTNGLGRCINLWTRNHEIVDGGHLRRSMMI